MTISLINSYQDTVESNQPPTISLSQHPLKFTIKMAIKIIAIKSNLFKQNNNTIKIHSEENSTQK